MLLPASYLNGFAPRDGQPLYPSLWKGCVGAWNAGLGPSGLTLRDQSGLGNNGTLTNGPTFAASQGKYAMNLDGVNDYVSIASGIVFAPVFTISAFVSPSVLSGYRRIFCAEQAGTGYGYTLGLVGSKVWLQDYSASANIFPSATTGDLVVNVWSHVAFVSYSSSLRKLFFNGTEVLSDTQAGASSIATTRAFIGQTQNVQFFSGFIDDVRIYNRALSPDEIRTLATRRGIAYEMAPRRRSSVQVTTNRLRRALIGS